MAYESNVPADAEYLHALGQAAYSYCYMEWMAIWVIQKLDTKFEIRTTHEMTGGKIGAALRAAVKAEGHKYPQEVQDRLTAAYAAFFRAVDVRSDLLHAHPFTAAGNKQRLGRYKDGINYEWGPADIDEACKSFDALNEELNALFHRDMK